MKRRKGRNREEQHMDETWLIPYADLLTLLLALFIVLFASSQIDQKKFDQLSRSLNIAFHGGQSILLPSAVIPYEQSGLDRNRADAEHQTAGDTDSDRENADARQQQFEQETYNLEQLQQRIDEYIQLNGLTTQLKTGLDQAELKITISDNALFAPGKADLTPAAKEIAVAISGMLVEFPGYEIVISGHTDNVPMKNDQFADNWELSAGRSLSFMKVLLANKELDQARLSMTGHGENSPIASNDTPEGKAQNRRVEVSVKRNITE